jgi:uncharacterized repeat protein (TIGR01451 family)
MNIEMFGTLCDSGVTNTPTVGCTQRLNGTPKRGNQEGYPPKDPLWSCTGPIEMGRNGHDFYDCYVPRIHLKGPGQVTCTANTGLPGDSITFTVVGAGGGGGATTGEGCYGTGIPCEGGGNGSTLAAQCSATSNTLTWPSATGFFQLFRTPVGGERVTLTTAGTTGSFVDTNIQPGVTYAYYTKIAPPNTAASNVVACPNGGGATPDYPPPVCDPESQTAEVGQKVRLTATGGSGAFTWDISGGGVVDEGGNADISVVWTIAGLKAVQVNSGGKNDRCTVQVGQIPFESGVEDGRIGLTKQGRNLSLAEAEPHDQVSVSEGQIVQIALDVVNNTDEPLTGVLLRDTVPQGMTYRAGSLAVGGATVQNDDITTTGLAMGTLEPRDRADITYSLIADRVGTVAQGPQAVESRALVTTSEGTSDEAILKLTIEGTGLAVGTGGSGSAAGSINTGPDDALILALLIAAASALLYTGYTRSPAFRKREVDALGRERDPLDFRT